MILPVVIVIQSLLFWSCRSDLEKPLSLHRVKVVPSAGYTVPADSLTKPKVIPVDERRVIKKTLRKPNVIAAKTNRHPVGKPKITSAGNPKLYSSATDGLFPPVIMRAVDSPFMAGLPESVVAKEMVHKEQNSGNFSFYNKLQGLKQGMIGSLLEDRSGNLWVGTVGGGVAKFDGKRFTHFTEREGLCNNIVYYIIEDRAGNLWFANYGSGISKYDGRCFTRFSVKDGLCSNNIIFIKEDSHGNIWFASLGGGVSRYDGKSFTNFSSLTGLGNDKVWSILEDQSGNLWFATEGGGITRYDGSRYYRYTVTEGLASNNISCILEDHIGTIWFGTLESGVIKYDGKNFTNFTVNEGLHSNRIFCIHQDRSGNLWFGSNGNGLARFDGESFTHYTEREGLCNNVVTTILEDRSRNLWIGTNSGLARYRGNSIRLFTSREGLCDDNVFSIIEDQSGNIWFGTDGGGISKYDGHSFTNFDKNSGLFSNTIYSILQDRSGNFWFGTLGEGVMKYDGKTITLFTEQDGLGHNNVFCILEDKSGSIWFGTLGGGVTKFDGKAFTRYSCKEGLVHRDVTSIFEDRTGNLWFGTRGGGVTKFNGKRFTHFTIREGLSGNNIMGITEDFSGNLWFGTDNGISVFDGKRFIHLTEKEGLCNNSVFSVMIDRYGDLWFGTRYGLSKLSREKAALLADKINSDNVRQDDVFFRNLTYTDGFLGIGCYRNSILEARNGIIWIGTQERLTAFDPKAEPPDTVPPGIQLTGIDLFNESIDWAGLEQRKDTTFLLVNGVKVGKFRFDSISKWNRLPEKLSLAYNNNYLTFSFAGVTMVQPANVKYQYRLDGLDENWSAAANRTSAPYGNLHEGTYAFRVRAMNSEGIWSRELQYTFTIRPPWWRTWWMFTIYSIMTIGGLIVLLWWNGKRLRIRAKELENQVNKATLVIRKQKEEAEEQKRLVEEQKKVVEMQKKIVEEQKQIVELQKESVEVEQKRSNDLLLNILPAEVAEELKQTGKFRSKTYSLVTVLFTDFKDFTKVSEMVSAELLVEEINYCFSAFDRILPEYRVEKIKTIGDAYMCAAGLPSLNSTHAIDLVNAAIRIRDFMTGRRKEKESRGEIPFEIRIGIHTGPVVAGIVGLKKFQYDIWGDTVNIAARMEQNCEAGKINISGSTYKLVKEKFNCMYRGKIEAKNKGEIEMYFVEGHIQI